MEVDSLQALQELAALGGAVTILPRSVVTGSANVRTYQLVEPALARQLACISHPRRPVPEPAALLLETVAKHLQARAMRP